ncbi:XdhC family protein [Mongoliitalea daihaiensis]|uniref:XdhC family protein n=1 Tax=Mongoliitalea daihaiensis TaxID=2782006 RepID=UPI001F3D23EA|nr:XdhC/CoxI family protein [Mongoliitalea daihaiensis]UJP64140.1 XdhC family protein [Mongoliitalea daihaiensis]
MKELQEIIQQYYTYLANNEACALATVVKVDGSAYRRPGARMLVSENGQLTGAISGGCLEGDALRKAQAVIFKQKSSIVTYDTTDEDDQKFGIGLGCNGIIHVLIEPIQFEEVLNPIKLLEIALGKRETAVLLTLVDLDPTATDQPGTLACIQAEESHLSSRAQKLSHLNQFIDDTAYLTSLQSSIIQKIASEETLYCLVEPIHPPVHIWLFGAGNDTIPVTKFAQLLGWEVTLIDGRKTHANEVRFPGVNRIFVRSAEDALEGLSADAHTVALLMTHNFEYEATLLEGLLPLPLPYIGILGPKKKSLKLFERLENKGFAIPHERIYGPMGLHIGAEGSEAIALSVLSEIMAVLHHKPAGFLRELDGPIHASL